MLVRGGLPRLLAPVGGALVVSFATSCVGGAVPPTESPRIEAEALAPSAARSRLLASGGAAVPASSLDGLELPALPVEPGQRWWLRVSRREAQAGAGAFVEWCFGAGTAVRVDVPSTGGLDRFEWIAGPLVERGREATAPVLRTRGDFLVDLVRVGEAARPVDERPACRVLRDGRFELRGSAHARLDDPEWVLRLHREALEFLEHRLGDVLEGPLVLAAVAPEDWPDPGTGAFQVDRVVYFREPEMFRPWRYAVHELAHVFQDRWGPSPRFFREGMARVLERDALRSLYGLEPDHRESVAALRASRTRLEGARGEAGRMLLHWESGPESATGREEYRAADVVVDDLASRCGQDWARRVHAGLCESVESEPSTEVRSAAELTALLVERLYCVFGDPVLDWARDWQLLPAEEGARNP